jgi:hypothetical protein
MKLKHILTGISFLFFGLMSQAQNGLENIYVERYYVTDATDSIYSSPSLPIGSVTYRIYADMLPGYKLQSVYGSPQHTLLMNTTTEFFNQDVYGSSIPAISAANTKKNTVMIDSWLTTGGACNGFMGIPKAEDNGVNNFVNTNVPALLQNNSSIAGIPLTVQDGMFSATVPSTATIGLDGIIDVFGDGSANGNQFLVTNGAWSCLTGATGPVPATNKVLIAQITTKGVFHFELNIQIGTPSLGTENYVSGNPTGTEITIPSLIQTLYPYPVPPLVTITSPAQNQTFTIGSSVPLAADASDPDGTVTQVEFFVDGVSAGIDASAPYTGTWQGLTEGIHVLTAKATDNNAMITTSAPVTFNIGNAPPVVAITSPQQGAVFIVTDPVTINATSSDPDGTVATLQIYVDGIAQGAPATGTSASLSASVIYTAQAGSHQITAKATDNFGKFTVSAPVTIQVNPNQLPSVSITSPANNSDFGIGVPVSISADASDADGSITQVEFFVDGNSIQTDGTAPFTAQYTGSVQATHILTARATDTYGGYTDSDPVTFNVVPLPYQCTLTLDLSRETISPDGIHIAGSFNNWNPSSTPMVAGPDHLYSVTLSLLEGTEYTYRFVNGNSNSGMEFVPAECGVAGGTGVYYRHLTMPSANTLMDTVCFSMCSRCPVDIPVTFRVDMSTQTVSPDGVHLAGTFNNWNPVSVPMAAGSNNQYEVTLMLTPGMFHQYRFVNGNTTAGFESVPDQCGSPSTPGGNARYMTIPVADTILPAFCFGSCVECGGSAQYIQVTFRVDMHHESISPDGVHIAGAFQGWQPGLTPMLTNGDSVYTFTQSFLSGSTQQYRFLNGITSADYEVVPASCAVNGNRTFTVPQTDTLLDAVCFASCSPCVPVEYRNVTFRVDMSMQIVSPNGVHLMGSFQGWNPATTAMLSSGNGVYTTTLQLPAGDPHQYRFVNGQDWTEAEEVPVECALSGNRFFQSLNDTLLPVTCFSKCGICDVGVQPEQAVSNSFRIYPNPFSSHTRIEFYLPVHGQVYFQLYNSLGQCIKEIPSAVFEEGFSSIDLDGSDFPAGVYYLKYSCRVESGEQSGILKVIRK